MKKQPRKRRMTKWTFNQVLHVSDVLEELSGNLEREGIAADTDFLRAAAKYLIEEVI